MVDQSLPASFVRRFFDQLRACDQPLIEAWAWPWSGKWRLLEQLATEDPAAWAGLGDTDLKAAVNGSSARWLVAEGTYDSQQLLAAAAVLGPGQRLVLPIDCRSRDRVLPLRSMAPSRLLLRGSEIEELFGSGTSAARIEELRRVSDGWLGPLLWLRANWSSEESLEATLSRPDFTDRFAQRVLSRLDAETTAVIQECAVAEEVDAPLWRRVWTSQPSRLAAFERLIDDWGWLISEPGKPARLPRLLRRVVRAGGLPGRNERDLFRRLGVAAHNLGTGAKAERYLRLAGEAKQLELVRQLRRDVPAGPAGTPIAGRPAAAVAPVSDRLDAPSERSLQLGTVAPSDSVTASDSATLSHKPIPAHKPIPSHSAALSHSATLSGAAVSPPKYRLQLLGQPVIQRIESDGSQRELSWRLHRSLLSIAYLALAPGHRATKDELVDAIWQDASERSIRQNFHPTLSEARRALASKRVFVYRQGIYVLNPEFGWWVDCERFREQITAGRLLLTQQPGEEQRALDAWLEAWGLYHGPLLSGSEAAWLRPQRDALYQDYAQLLRNIGDLCTRLDRRTLAIDAYRSLLIEEPFEERVHLAVMELYARQGRRDLVRRQFIRMQELLVNELNVEPLEGTQERYHQLMR